MKIIKSITACLLMLSMVFSNIILLSASENWKTSYSKLLSEYNSNHSFVLFDLNKDLIPELIVSYDKTVESVTSKHQILYSYNNGKIIEYTNQVLDDLSYNKFSEQIFINYIAQLHKEELTFLNVNLYKSDKDSFENYYRYFTLDGNEVKWIGFSIIDNESINQEEFDSREFIFIPITSENISIELDKWNDYSMPSIPIQISVKVDGQAFYFHESYPQIINESIMLPLHIICESLDMDVDYDDTTNAITIQKDSLVVMHTIYSNTISINGISLDFDTTSTIIDGHIFVPISMLEEAIGTNIEWIEETKTIFIDTEYIFKYKPVQYYIGWEFIAYKEPNFMSEAIGTLSPQTVNIIRKFDNDWALIDTYIGEYWVNIKVDTSFIKSELDNLVNSYGSGVSVYYENLSSGYNYSYNDKKQYYSASIIKAPYVLYLYDLADKEKINLDTSHTYTREKYRGGAGVINKMPYGTVLTEADLLGYSIIDSDNVAFRMLLSIYGVNEFKEFISEFGGRTSSLNNLTNAYMNLEDVAFYTKSIYNYIESSGINNEKLKQELLSSKVSYITSDSPMANKYGLWDKAMHDMAIVYADSPYILVIMTDKGVSNGRDAVLQKFYPIFQDISQKVQEINNIFE